MTEDVLGYAIETRAPSQFLGPVIDRIRGINADSRGCQWLACLNVHSFAVARGDQTFTAALKDATWLVPDGIGVVVASRWCGGVLRNRVTGSDVFLELSRRLDVKGAKVFFLGSTEHTLRLIRDRMAQDFPHLNVVGTYAPPFKPSFTAADTEEMIRAVNASGADILWVGLTAPKQEKWIYENRARLQVKFAGAVGAVFDFYAGTVKRSHPLVQRAGLEWFDRLLRDPRRMWRRSIVSGQVFGWALVRAVIASLLRRYQPTE